MPSSDPNLLLLLDRKPPAQVGAETGLELPRLHLGPRDAAALGSRNSSELLQSYLNHLATPLLPLVSCINGQPHPDFPRNLLQYHLLTPAQLDNLAWHFHQVSPPRPESSRYPIRVPPWVHLDSTREIRLETKRRRFGRFIGLQGCESPVQAMPQGVSPVYEPFLDSCESFADQVVVAPLLGENEMEIIDRMLEGMEWEWEEALVKAREGLGLGPGVKQ
ncbi:uncharacterized protein N7477_003134 [Penicillium maclennaniae]|uniref:uncharacterized protein n=1 Tax=Penicillium maclennaniae TaxID=1343394 RepID=UPI00254107B1|nr:uncharacterized protein N7477_003134 [Penicillium maclennaniae]KAJ5677501.1 hypothetical protein N7477_003134 [Penicillium maclennaniae]